MISALSWIRKGASKEYPEKFVLNEEEFKRIASEIGSNLEEAKLGLQHAMDDEAKDDNEDAGDDEMMDVEESKGEKGKQKVADGANPTDDEISKLYNMDDYDNDDDIEDIPEDGDINIPGLGNIRGLTYHNNNTEDPYIHIGDEVDEEEDREEMRILPENSLLVAAKTDDHLSHLEIYLYEDEEENLYVHHDIMLPSFPLCLEWMDFKVGRKAGEEGTGNYIAVGTFEPEIEIWDLDTIEVAYPDVVLGKGAAAATESETSTSKKKKKKSKKSAKAGPNPNQHVDAIMALSWNKKVRNLLASGSADATVKLWDLSASPSSAVRSFSHHGSKVQAVQWNSFQPTVLLTGGYDRKACMFDSRSPEQISSWDLSADVECMKWDPFAAERFLVSTEDGLVQCFDFRTVSPKNKQQQAVFTINAHDAAVSALDVNPNIPGMIITGSTDKKAKVWAVVDDKPRCVASRDVGAGKVFSASFATDSPFIAAIAGSKGSVVIWNLEDNSGIRQAFSEARKSLNLPDEPVASETQPQKKEFLLVEENDEDDSEDEEAAEDMLKQLAIENGADPATITQKDEDEEEWDDMEDEDDDQ
ncbi:hypothetical protein HK098_005915 [Nowakowskiella sp. JEL0407]|nr:hypothetical protein HK098_005915 [Nowakowskiella sp. JEL0407]